MALWDAREMRGLLNWLCISESKNDNSQAILRGKRRLVVKVAEVRSWGWATLEQAPLSQAAWYFSCGVSPSLYLAASFASCS